MIGLFNKDSSYFNIRPRYSVGGTLMGAINDKIISLSITEEVNHMINGTLEVYDPFSTNLDRILTPGRNVTIEWGYGRPDLSPNITSVIAENGNEVQGPFSRSITAYLTGPSGQGGADGVVTYSCNFISSEYWTGGASTSYENTTPYVIVSETFARMKITQMLISFKQMSDPIRSGSIVQNSSNFKFLNELSRRYNCVFCISQGQTGSVGLFADYDSGLVDQFSKLVGMSIGSSVTLGYRDGISNVESYSFQQLAGDAGGDNVQIVNMGPQGFVLKRFIANEERVVDYVINVNKINAEIKAKGSASGIVDYVNEVMKIDSFQTLVNKGYFDKKESRSAPQGYGWTFKVRMIGNPLVTSPMRVSFGKGFPSVVQSSSPIPKTKFWTQSVTHIVDTNGYHMDLDIADALTIQGGSYIGVLS